MEIWNELFVANVLDAGIEDYAAGIEDYAENRLKDQEPASETRNMLWEWESG